MCAARQSTTRLFVWRDREQARLHEQLAAAVAGQGGVVLISGEAGIGKTTLAEMIGQQAVSAGATLLVGHCYDLADTPPYGPWIELFAHYRSDDRLPLPRALTRHGVGEEAASQAIIFQQAQDVLADLAERHPLVLLLEDLHWADAASIALLRSVARSLEKLPLLILATYRADELPRQHQLYQLLPALVRESNIERIELRPLAADEIRELVAARYRLAPTDSARLRTYLHERAEGNPFFIGELLRALEEGAILTRSDAAWSLGDLARARVPSLLRQIIDGRLARLDETSQKLLAIAAVIGHTVPLDLWAAVGMTDEETLLDVVERGLAARVLSEAADEASAEFAHALVRAALYEGLPGPRRRRIHLRIAEALADGRAPDPDMVAHHFQRAGDTRAVDWLIAAGERAQVAYAYRTAASRFDAALALMGQSDEYVHQRAELLYRAGVAHRLKSYRQSVAYFDEALPLALQTGDHALAARIRVYRGAVYCYLNEFLAGIAELRAGVDELEALPPADQTGRIRLDAGDVTISRGTLICFLAYAGLFTEVEEQAARYLAEPAASATGPEAIPYAGAYYGLAIAQAFRGQPDAARHNFEHAQALYGAAGHTHVVGFVTYFMLREVIQPYYTDDAALLESVTNDAVAAWGRPGEEAGDFPASTARLPTLALRGRWDEAGELGKRLRFTIISPETASPIGQIVYAQGDCAFVATLIEEVLPAGVATPVGSVRFPFGMSAIQRLAAELAIGCADFATARSWLEAHDRWLAWSEATLGQAEGQVMWSRYYRACGDARQAYEHAATALAYASEPRQPLALLAAHRALGELATDARRLDAARTHLHAALTLAEVCAAPYERALTLLAFAELAVVCGDKTSALALCEQVRAICLPLKARPTLARTDTLTERLVDTVPSVRYPAGLTWREIEVLRLVAAGRTNRQIAETLFLTEKTVKNHMTHILTKIDASNRAAAVGFALRNGLT